MRSERRLALLLALLGGCSYEWNALRPGQTFPADVLFVDAVVAPDVVVAPDALVAPDVVVTPDVVVAPDVVVPDVATADVVALQDVFDVVTPDAVDASAPDVVDVPPVMDRPDVVDVPPPRDIVDVVTPDVVDVPPARDVVDVPPVTDTGPTCTGLSCPCHPGNPTGYCLVGQRCTAGACADATPAGALVITEIMNDAIIEPEGEWFEVYNPASYAVDLRGLRVVDSNSSGVIPSSGPALLVLPLGYAVLARTTNLGISGGMSLALATYGNVALVNSGSETLTVQTAAGTVIDTLTFGSGWPNIEARSKSLRPGILDAVMNNTSTNWCAAGTLYGAMHYGTPGAPNSCM